MECEFCHIEPVDRQIPTGFVLRELCNTCAEIHGRRSPVVKFKRETADARTSVDRCSQEWNLKL